MAKQQTAGQDRQRLVLDAAQTQEIQANTQAIGQLSDLARQILQAGQDRLKALQSSGPGAKQLAAPLPFAQGGYPSPNPRPRPDRNSEQINRAVDRFEGTVRRLLDGLRPRPTGGPPLPPPPTPSPVPPPSLALTPPPGESPVPGGHRSPPKPPAAPAQRPAPAPPVPPTLRTPPPPIAHGRGPTFPVSAFDRPVPVIVMGPKPLLVKMEGGPGGGAPPPGGSPPPGNPPAPGGASMTSMLKFAVGEALQQTQNIYRALDDRHLTENQRWRSIIKGLPFGETGLSTYDLFMARNKKMQVVTEEHEVSTASLHGQIERERTQALHLSPMLAAREAHSHVMSKAAPTLMPVIDRSTATGERLYRETARLLPLQKAQVEATRGVAEATLRRQEAEKQYNKTIAEGTSFTSYATNRSKKIEELLKRPEYQSGSERLDLVLERERLLKGIQSSQQTRQGAAERVDRAKVEEAAARRTEKTAFANTREEQANIKEARAETAAGSARRMARLGVAGRAEGEIYLRMLKQNPQLATLSPEFAERASQIDPEYVEKLLEQQGEKLPEYQRAAKEKLPSFPLGPGEGIEDTRKEAIRERNQAEKDRLAAQQEEAQKVAESGKQLGMTVNEAMTKALQSAIDEIKNKWIVQRGMR